MQMPPSDDDLLKKATAGDADALTVLLERYGPPVRRSLAGQIPKRWQALLSDDDVMQQTYADAVRDIGRFVSQGDGSFARWLATLARCNVRDAVKMLEARKRGGGLARSQQASSDESFMALFEEVAASGTTPTQHAARAEVRTTLKEAINALPPAYRQAVEGYDLQGRSIDEVAMALGRSPGAIYMLRARALDQLHELLGRTSKFFDSPP